MINVIKQTQSKLPPKKEVVLKKKLADIRKDIDWLMTPKNELTSSQLEKMLAKYFSGHPKLQLVGNDFRQLWARLSIFAENEMINFVPYVAHKKWTGDQIRFLACQICLAKQLLPLVLKLASGDPDPEE